jgi:hypothetical protein
VLKEASEKRSAPACYTLGCAALELKFDRGAMEAFHAALCQPGIDARMMETILQSARVEGLDAAATLRMLSASRIPASSNMAIRTRLGYLRLLAGEDMPGAQRDLDSLGGNSASDAYVCFLNALSLHRHGDVAGAGRKVVPLRPQQWNEGEAAVIAGMMAAAGQYQEGASFMEKIDLRRLFPEERAMVAPWLSHMSSAVDAVSLSSGKVIVDEQP